MWFLNSVIVHQPRGCDRNRCFGLYKLAFQTCSTTRINGVGHGKRSGGVSRCGNFDSRFECQPREVPPKARTLWCLRFTVRVDLFSCGRPSCDSSRVSWIRVSSCGASPRLFLHTLSQVRQLPLGQPRHPKFRRCTTSTLTLRSGLDQLQKGFNGSRLVQSSLLERSSPTSSTFPHNINIAGWTPPGPNRHKFE